MHLQLGLLRGVRLEVAALDLEPQPGVDAREADIVADLRLAEDLRRVQQLVAEHLDEPVGRELAVQLDVQQPRDVIGREDRRPAEVLAVVRELDEDDDRRPLDRPDEAGDRRRTLDGVGEHFL